MIERRATSPSREMQAVHGSEILDARESIVFTSAGSIPTFLTTLLSIESFSNPSWTTRDKIFFTTLAAFFYGLESYGAMSYLKHKKEAKRIEKVMRREHLELVK